MYPENRLVPPSTDHPELAIFGLDGGPRPRTLIDIARTTMDRFPDAVAIDCDGDRLTYGEFSVILEEQVKRLHDHGIGRGDRVGIRVPPGTMQSYVAVLATLFAGAAYVPVDWGDTEDRAEAIWKAGEVDVVYGADLELTVLRQKTGAPDASAPGPEDDAWLFFSGPADKLAGVVTTHRSAAGVADAQAMAYLADAPLRPGDRVMTRQSIASIPSTKEMWLSWCQAATLVPTPCAVLDSSEALREWIVDRRITVLATLPSLVEAWPQQTLHNVRLLILAGEDTPRGLIEQLRHLDLEIWTGYRATGTVLRIAGGASVPPPPLSAGRPIPGSQLCVIDPQGKPVRWGETGEVVLAGLGLDRHLDPARDAEAYRPLPALGWERAYYTGQLVRAERTGLVPVDRADSPARPNRPRRRWRWWPRKRD
ncbi:AMP-binding protein [Corynebacterium halotolerans]|uniref:Peptide synthase n=1 Tax=Corynebacterium halotolerans YIM 70093 = DSM 44683 TaxID=1121362 RepID=M1NZV6_9CORY|nr:AMP-binding protein [Corynebacterium halotolerans]AGF73030.1 peptide synthase [Corynebacterium halotolerans YIM 70093 = DSM 44683]